MISASQITELIEGDLQGNSNLVIRGAYDLVPGKKFHISFLNNVSINSDGENPGVSLASSMPAFISSGLYLY